MSIWIFCEFGREGVDAAGDAVVEARADGDHHIAIVHGEVGLVRAVHAEHAEPLLVGGRIGAEAHQGRGDGKAGEAHQLAQDLARLRPGIDHAAAGVEHRPLGARHQVDRFAHGVLVRLHARLVGLVRDVRRADVVAGRELDVLGDVDHHRAGAAGLGDIERLVQHARQVVDVLHQPVVLGAGPRDADRIAFLERVVADEVRRHLPGDADERDGIHQRVGEAGHRVGGAGAGRDERDADLAGRARIAFRRMQRAAFLAHEDVLDLVLLEQLVVDRQHGAAGVAEDMLDALIDERREHHLGARHRACHCQLQECSAAAAAAGLGPLARNLRPRY